jgi:hypothetical protein
MRPTTMLRCATVALAVLPVIAHAQQPAKRPARRTQAIEIRGQVPTPQVVTVRPREMPTYSRQVLVPNFYDHDFWQSILPGYQVVSRRTITGSDSMVTATGGGRPFGVVPLDSAGAAEAAAIQRELEERRARVNRLGARLDTLYAPGGVKPSALDSATAANSRLPMDTTTRRPVQPDTTRRPIQTDTTTRRPPSGTASANRQR